ncbi:2Fe-2S iron-sulfur cluster-binding protein [Streptomyces sp. NPDC058001]|uniref:2Fe-2S iron-sulfur cluster-binding protein n=1 Tax=Streptomyces sp. NPDC058001 TaxID=3346300 RepID=UPI0036EA5862
MTGEQNNTGGWQPLPQGEYDSDATAFVKLPEGGIDALANSPLAAPGHGYVPPQITVTPAAAEATDPAATGTWVLPGAVTGAVRTPTWPDPEALPDVPRDGTLGGAQGGGYDTGAYDPRSTGQWSFSDPAEAQRPPADVTGQWSIPVADGDLPEESGEFSTSSLASRWGGTPPATLPGGAAAPWATDAGAGDPWAPEAPGTAEALGTAGPQAQAPGAPGMPHAPHVPHAPGAQGVPGAHGAQGAPVTDPRTVPPRAEEPPSPDPYPYFEERAVPAERAAPREHQRHPGHDVHAVDDDHAVREDRSAHFAREEHAVREDGVGHGDRTEHAVPAAPSARVPTIDGISDGIPDGIADPHAPADRDETPADHAPVAEPTEADPEDEPAADRPADHPEAEGADTARDAVAVPEAETAPDENDDTPPVHHDEHPLVSYVLRVNGTDRPVTDAWIGESLLYVLRERLGLAGAKDGCSQGECGACNVQVDGRLVASCLVPSATTAGSEVRTVEGLAADGQPSDVQRALAKCGAVQCGFCVPGMAMTVHDLLEGNPAPSDLETRQALCGNLCRCSGYRGVLDAVREVVAERASSATDTEHDDGGGDTTGEFRIPHQAGPGAGGVQPTAHETYRAYGQDGGPA